MLYFVLEDNSKGGEEMKDSSVKKAVAIGVGSAVYFILAKFVAIPLLFVPNTTLQTTYAFLGLMGFVFGPIVGLFVGLIGHVLNDMLSYGSVWWSWVFATAFFGFAIGMLGHFIKIEDFNKKKMGMFIVGQAIICFIAWGIIAPTFDIIIYSEPVGKVFTQGMVVFLTNALITGTLGTILIATYSKTITSKGSLSKEN